MLSFNHAPFDENIIKNSNAIVVILQKKSSLSSNEQNLDLLCANSISFLVKSKQFEKQLDSLYLPICHPQSTKINHLFLIQLDGKTNKQNFIRKLNTLASKIKTSECTNSYVYYENLEISEMSDEQIDEQICLNIANHQYLFDKHKSKTQKSKLKVVNIFNPNSTKKTKLTQINALIEGINLCKDLANEPSNICTPVYLAKTAKKLTKDSNIRCQILDEKQMKKLKMGSLLSVSKGSIQSPRMIFLSYFGASKNQKPIALVGKGVCFDTGGISIKPSSAMDEMKYDMCGAASVIGTIKAISQAKLKINVVGVMVCVENMPSSTATKPGDIVQSYSGKSIEILNTDAEGRLILVDALSYTIEKYKPTKIVDIATLTGAVIIALGKLYSAVLGNDQDLIAEIISAGKISNDLTWNLPLDDRYLELLHSNFADIANVGNRDAGVITAAQFIAEFTKKAKWAHLDIAGIAWNAGKAKGATARPVPLLFHFIKANQS